MPESEIYRCVACGGTDICFGYLGTTAGTFVPSGIFTIGGYRLRSYVCLKCGHVSSFIPRDKLDRLREKFAERVEGEV